jgi:hypothetical protein
MSKLKYNLETIAPLSSVKVIVSKYVPSNQIVMRAPKPAHKRPSLSPEIYVSFFLSVWDLDTGEIHGDCKPEDATEWHMSPERYKQLQDMLTDYDQESALHTPNQRERE